MSLLGPIGGPGGSIVAPTLGGRLQSVTVNGGDWINGIQFSDDLGTVITAGDMSAETLLTFQVNEGDTFNQIAVTFDNYVNKLVFEMTSGVTHTASGANAGPHNGVLTISKKPLVGFNCRAGSYLDAFGVQTGA